MDILVLNFLKHTAYIGRIALHPPKNLIFLGTVGGGIKVLSYGTSKSGVNYGFSLLLSVLAPIIAIRNKRRK